MGKQALSIHFCGACLLLTYFTGCGVVSTTYLGATGERLGHTGNLVENFSVAGFAGTQIGNDNKHAFSDELQQIQTTKSAGLQVRKRFDEDSEISLFASISGGLPHALDDVESYYEVDFDAYRPRKFGIGYFQRIFTYGEHPLVIGAFAQVNSTQRFKFLRIDKELTDLGLGYLGPRYETEIKKEKIYEISNALVFRKQFSKDISVFISPAIGIQTISAFFFDWNGGIQFNLLSREITITVSQPYNTGVGSSFAKGEIQGWPKPVYLTVSFR